MTAGGVDAGVVRRHLAALRAATRRLREFGPVDATALRSRVDRWLDRAAG